MLRGVLSRMGGLRAAFTVTYSLVQILFHVVLVAYTFMYLLRRL